MPSLSPPAELLLALSRVSTELGIGWFVFGAQAVLYWGRPRLTEDVDVTVQLGPVATRDFVTRMERAGFALRVEGTPTFISQTRVVPFEFGSTGWALDVVLGGPGLEEDFLTRAIPTEVAPGVVVPFISPEDLIVTKLLAGRPKDLEDVRGILSAQAGHLDIVAIRRLLGMLEDALGVSDLRPAFEALVRS